MLGLIHRVKMKAGILIIYSICILASNALAEFKPVDGVTLEEMLGGEKIKRIITISPTIEVFRLGEHQQQTQPAKFETSKTPDVIDALTNVKNYGELFVCLFDPGVKFRFSTAEGILDIVICFTCGEMRLYLDGSVIERIIVVNRTIIFAGSKNSFSPVARRAFVSIAKKAFPKDTQIQSLHQ